jgi:hypothetical protein
VRARSRAPFLILAIAACGGASIRPEPPPAAEAPLANVARPCSDAAAGIERATKSLREPESSVLQPMKERCEQDTWPPAAVDCFATMAEGDVRKCVGLLADRAQTAMLAVLTTGGGVSPILAAQIRLSSLVVNIPECDQLIHSIVFVLGCQQISVKTRVVLAESTGDFWSLPPQLPADARARMAKVCADTSNDSGFFELTTQAHQAGCMP